MSEVISGTSTAKAKIGSWALVGFYFLLTACCAVVLLAITSWLFRSRWRLTGRG